MICIIIGTKAQFIKMAPIIKLISERAIPFCIVDLAQHAILTSRILDDFGLSHKTICPIKQTEDVSSYFQGLLWLLKNFALLLRRSNLRKVVSVDKKCFALVHGDTASTFIGMLYAKRLGIPVGLVEAGLTSGSLLSPFPEEFIRRTVERFADTLFAPGRAESDVLLARRMQGNIVNTQYNTGRDALEIIVPPGKDAEISGSYAVCTLHRLETISNKSHLRNMVEYLIAMGKELGKLIFVMHEPTRRALLRYSLLTRLTTTPGIEIMGLQSYPDFIRLLRGAKCVLTDGGSVQEEASYLNKPCLILRNRTERPHGLGTTAFLANFDPDEDIRKIFSCKQEEIIIANQGAQASKIIADFILRHVENT